MSSSTANPQANTAESLPELRRSFSGARTTPPRPKPAAPQRRAEKPVIGAVLIFALALLAAFSLQSALRRALSAYWGSWAGSAALAEAAALDPLNPVVRRRAAFLDAQRSGDPGEAIPGLSEVVERTPLNLTPRLELAATLQAAGKDDEAEAVLLEAAKLDQGYRPRWSLTNFYLRKGRIDDFWESARQTLLAYPESAPMVLGLCWRAFGDSTLILDKAVPDSPEVYRRYFAYLLQQERLDALDELWPKLAPVMEARDVPMASLFLDRLILAQEVEPAVQVWNHLCRESFLSYIPLNYPDGPYLTNGDFAARVSGVGFDWKIPPAAGVFRVQRPTDFGTRALEVRLSGGQSENALLVSQVVPLPVGRYLFRYEYATQGLPRLTGLFWVVRDNQTERVLARSPIIDAAEDYWNTLSFLFDAPEDVKFFRLEFRYALAEGTTKHRGRYVMRHAAVSAVENEGAAE
jgi:hypothetical protein